MILADEIKVLLEEANPSDWSSKLLLTPNVSKHWLLLPMQKAAVCCWACRTMPNRWRYPLHEKKHWTHRKIRFRGKTCQRAVRGVWFA